MIIALWLVLKIKFILCGLFLIYAMTQSFQQNDREAFVRGLKNALRDCGLSFPKKSYSVELYKWVANDNEELCEESMDRTDWPAMDIADWMKAGLPCSSEGESLCGQECSCTLVLCKKTHVPTSQS